MTDGTNDWTFAGTATVEGELRALIVNKVTNATVFLSVGETWKELKLVSVDGNTIVIEGTSGNTPPITLRGNNDMKPIVQGNNPVPPEPRPRALAPALAPRQASP